VDDMSDFALKLRGIFYRRCCKCICGRT